MIKPAEIMAICNQKGGVGKTVTTISLGIGLARMGKRVLLADIDAQGGDITLCFRWRDSNGQAEAGYF